MQALLECCCGIDIRKDMIEICILKGLSEKPEIIRQQFKTTTGDLLKLTSYPKNTRGRFETTEEPLLDITGEQ